VDKKYTDGSKKDERAGYAVTKPHLQKESTSTKHRHQHTTRQGDSHWLTEHTEGDQREQLYQKSGNEKTKEMMDRLKKQITLMWVPGHMSIPRNEQADEEAKAALDDDTQQNEKYLPKRSRKIVKNRNDKYQKRPMEKRKQQHERKKDRTRIWRRHKTAWQEWNRW
jgi:hypothetical protein